MNVASLMTREVTCCREDEPLSAAAERMWSKDCGVLPVTDHSGKVIGMVTDRDICMSTWMNASSPQALLVAAAMSRSLVSCGPEDSLDAAEQLMRKNQVRRLPVLDRAGELAGILSLADIVRETERTRGRGAREVAAAEVAATLAAINQPHDQMNGRSARA